MSYYLTEPGSRLDYAIDWLGYLEGQAVAASIWTVRPEEPGGIEVENSSFDLGRTAARLSGGVTGHVYSITNRVTLSDGSIDERSIHLRVEER
jgi:hypothetical protein